MPFPFSNLVRSKARPAVLLASCGQGDWIACQITSNPFADKSALEITHTDFLLGGLNHLSYVRPGKLFTANESIFALEVGTLQTKTFQILQAAVVKIIMTS